MSLRLLKRNVFLVGSSAGTEAGQGFGPVCEQTASTGAPAGGEEVIHQVRRRAGYCTRGTPRARAGIEPERIGHQHQLCTACRPAPGPGRHCPRSRHEPLCQPDRRPHKDKAQTWVANLAKDYKSEEIRKLVQTPFNGAVVISLRNKGWPDKQITCVLQLCGAGLRKYTSQHSLSGLVAIHIFCCLGYHQRTAFRLWKKHHPRAPIAIRAAVLKNAHA